MTTDNNNPANVGRPTKYCEKTIKRLCEALADGMPQRGACVLASVGVTTLTEWKERHPEIEQRMEEARERFRQKALQTMKKAIVGGDWRAANAALPRVFPEYRDSGANVNIAVGVQVTLPEEERIRLIRRRDKALLANRQSSASA